MKSEKKYTSANLSAELISRGYTDLYIKCAANNVLDIPPYNFIWDNPPIFIVDCDGEQICYFLYKVNGLGQPMYGKADSNGYNSWYFVSSPPSPKQGNTPLGCISFILNGEITENCLNSFIVLPVD